MTNLPFSEGEKPSLSSAVHQTVGAASMCWENVRAAGAYDEEEATKVAQRLLNYIHDRDQVLVEQFLEWLLEGGHLSDTSGLETLTHHQNYINRFLSEADEAEREYRAYQNGTL